MERFETVLPGKVWDVSTYTNNIYKITDTSGNCLATFLPKSSPTKLSNVLGVNASTEASYIVGNQGCTTPQFSDMYGMPVAVNGNVLKNNTSKNVLVFYVDKLGVKQYPGKMLLPNEVLSLTTTTTSLYHVTTEEGVCLGAFIPKNGVVQLVTSISLLVPSNSSDYKINADGCNYRERSGMYGEGVSTTGDIIKNDSPVSVIIEWIKFDASIVQQIELLPGKVWNATVLTNSLYRVKSVTGTCLGMFVPKQGEMLYVTSVTGLLQATNNNFVTGTAGCSLNQYSGMYGSGITYSGAILVNDTKLPVGIQLIDLTGKIVSLGVLVMPGREWSTNTSTNYVYRIDGSAGECLGILVPKQGVVQKVSVLTGMPQSTIDDYKTSTGSCSTSQYSNMYGTGTSVSGTIINNDTNVPIRIYYIDATGREIFSQSENSNAESFDSIMPGQNWTVSTTTSSVYKITDQNNNCLGLFVPINDNTIKVSDLTTLPPGVIQVQPVPGPIPTPDNGTGIVPSPSPTPTPTPKVDAPASSNMAMYAVVFIVLIICIFLAKSYLLTGASTVVTSASEPEVIVYGAPST